jgi:hypothetical protein
MKDLGSAILAVISVVAVVVLMVSMTRYLQVDLKTKYDERQLAILGKGCKYSANAMIGCLVVSTVLNELGVLSQVGATFIMLAIAAIGITVYSAYGIWRGALFGIGGLSVTTLVLWFTIGIVDGVAGAMSVADDLAAGVPLCIESSCCVVLGAMFLVLGLLALVRRGLDRRESRA